MLPKTLPTGHNCLWTSKTGSNAAGTFSYSRKTRSYQFPTTPTQLPNGFKPTKRNKLHYTTPTHNNSRLTHLNKRVGKTTCTSQQNCKDNQRLSRSFTLSALHLALISWACCFGAPPTLALRLALLGPSLSAFQKAKHTTYWT